MSGLHAWKRFRMIRFIGGPYDGTLQRVQVPLPERLLLPVAEGRERTWGKDETRLVGVARYALRSSAGRWVYELTG